MAVLRAVCTRAKKNALKSLGISGITSHTAGKKHTNLWVYAETVFGDQDAIRHPGYQLPFYKCFHLDCTDCGPRCRGQLAEDLFC